MTASDFEHLQSALAALQETLSWFRSNPDLRRLCAISSLDEQKLRLIDQFIYEGFEHISGHTDSVVDEGQIRALIEACLALERTVTSEILPVLKIKLAQRGPARNDQAMTQLQITRESIEPNTERLVKRVCEVRAAALSAAKVS